MWALLCIMKLRPTWSEEFASPRGCSSSAEASSSAAELTAPGGEHEPAAASPSPGRPGRPRRRWSTRRPVPSVTMPPHADAGQPAGRGRSRARGRSRRSRRRSWRRAGTGSRRRSRSGCRCRPVARSMPIAFELGVHALGAQPLGEVGDVRLVLERPGTGTGALRHGLGRVLAGRAVDPVDPLGLGVVGLEVGVAERPGGRGALVVLDRVEVVLAEPRQARAVDLGVAADDVVDAGGERPPGAVEPAARPACSGARRTPPAATSSRARAAGAGRARAQDVDAAPGQRERRRGAAHAGPDDHDVGAQVGHDASRPSRHPRRSEVLDCRA